MSSADDHFYHIRDRLDKIIDLLSKLAPEEEHQVGIPINESEGSCPLCDGIKVALTEVGNAIVYNCAGCGYVWRNK